VGSDASNRLLSEQRAKTVVAYLVANECRAANLIAKGYGEIKPVASNGTDEGRQQNRRVEFRVLHPGATAER
jgi:OOP family OmpA-OmpF porin